MDINSEFPRNKLRPVYHHGIVCNFLGAGFSADTSFRLPVSNGFISSAFPRAYADQKGNLDWNDFDPSCVGRGCSELLDYLKKEFGELGDLNLETIMTELYVRVFGVGRSWENWDPIEGKRRSLGELAADYEMLLRYVRERLTIDGPGFYSCPKVARLLDSLKWQDSILTLNYDTIVESHFNARHNRDELFKDRMDKLVLTIGPPAMGYGSGSPSIFGAYMPIRGGVFTKLHGSIDWLTCSNRTCPNSKYIGSMQPWFGQPTPPPHGDRCEACSMPLYTVIVPPTASKDFDRFPKLYHMWRQSYNALLRASRWTFIGVSFADTDFHLKSLLHCASRDCSHLNGRNGNLGQICVVNKDKVSTQHAAERLKRFLAPDVRKMIDENKNMFTVFYSVDAYLDVVGDVDKDREEQVLMSG